MLEAKSVTKRYGKKKALDQCSLSIKPYEIVGILGRNGCGKSTLFKSIMGLIKLSDGHFIYDGHDITETQRHRFGYMPEQRSLLPDLTLDEHLYWMGSLKKMDPHYLDERIQILTEQFGLDTKRHLALHTFSKGQQQKAQLLTALLNDPNVLILDEPLNGLDLESVSFFMKQLKKLAAQGKIILISSHQMEFMDELCTSFIVLNEGKVVKSGRLEQLLSNDLVVVKVNASCDWTSIRRIATEVKEMGTMIQFSFTSLDEASKVLSKVKSLTNLHTLRLESSSLVDVFLDNA